MDCLKPGDIAIFATPLAFRWVHFAYAIEKGLNVFMEKPLTADGPTSRRMIALAEESEAKGLKVGVGLMSRHSRALQELYHRIQDGEIGDIITMRGYRMTGPVGSAFSEKWPGQPSELLWQIKQFHSFIWASGGCFNDFYIHVVDHCCWMKDAWPVKAQALGGRHYRGDFVDQNFDVVFGGIHLRRRRQADHGRALHGRLREHLLQLRARQQRHGDRVQVRRLRAAFQDSTRARIRTLPTWSGNPRWLPTSAIRT